MIPDPSRAAEEDLTVDAPDLANPTADRRLVVRAPDSGEALLDVDGNVISELQVEAVDLLDDGGRTVAELVLGRRSWRFGHVIVDEAQDLTPMQWRMVARRARGGSMTIVGDLAQRSGGPAGSWEELLPDGLTDVRVQELTINYRSPAEVNGVAAGLLAELAPGLTAPCAIRSIGVDPEVRPTDDVAAEVRVAVHEAALDGGRIAVIVRDPAGLGEIDGADVLDPWRAKGLEFDTVIVVEPADIVGPSDDLGALYVAITRTTARLVLVHARPLPEELARALSSG